MTARHPPQLMLMVAAAWWLACLMVQSQRSCSAGASKCRRLTLRERRRLHMCCLEDHGMLQSLREWSVLR